MYCGGSEMYKSEFLFKLIQSKNTLSLSNGSPKLLKAIEHMTLISCLIMSEAMLREAEEFSEEEDEK